jgi:hypothetical protein
MPFPNFHAQTGHVRSPALESVNDLRDRIDSLRRSEEQAGRSQPLEIAFMALPMRTRTETPRGPEVLDAASELARAGVTYILLQVPPISAKHFIDTMELYAREVLPYL